LCAPVNPGRALASGDAVASSAPSTHFACISSQRSTAPSRSRANALRRRTCAIAFSARRRASGAMWRSAKAFS
jgi:hypothetical protein